MREIYVVAGPGYMSVISSCFNPEDRQ